MKKFRILAMILAVTFVLAGCGGNKGAQNGGNDEKMVFTMTSMATDEDAAKSASYQVLKDKFNVDFDLYYYTQSDFQEKTRIWMASGDIPDIMQTKIVNNNYNEYLTWVEEGLVREIPDLTPYPNLKKLADNCPTDRFFNSNGRYAWLSYNPDTVTSVSGYGWFYRYDLVKELGLAHDNHEYTWEEYLEILRALKEKYSDNKEFVPLTMDSYLYPYGTGIMMYSPYWETYVLRDGEYMWGMDLPETTEGMEFARMLHREGLIPQDIAVYKSSEGTNKFKVGNAGLLFNAIGISECKDIYNTFGEVFPDKDPYEAIKVMKVFGPDGKMWGQGGGGTNNIVTLFNPELTDEEMHRILSVMDYIASEEYGKIHIYGVEGKDYTMKDGEMVYKNADKSIDGGNPLLVFDMVRTRSMPEDLKRANYGSRNVDICNEYSEFLQAQDQSNFRVYNYDTYYFTGENYLKYGSFFFDGSEGVKRIIVGNGDVADEWAKAKAPLRDRVNLVLDELNTQLLNK